jgi:hypothetical protein
MLEREMVFKHTSLILFALGSLLYAGSSCVLADDPQLQSLPPVLDERQVKTAPLQGRINQNDMDQAGDATGRPLSGDASNSAPLNGDAQDNANANLRMLVPQSGSGLFHLSERKYTAQEFREMNYGVIGIVCLRPIFGGKQTVIAVYPGCPAALAGIRPGDVEVQADSHVLGNFESQRSTWNTTDGEAGTPVDITVRRGHDLLTFHLIRMNIEDIPEQRVRRAFERLLEKLGPPNKQSVPKSSD